MSFFYYTSLDNSISIKLKSFYEKCYNKTGINKFILTLAFVSGGPKKYEIKLTTNLNKCDVVKNLKRFAKVSPKEHLLWDTINYKNTIVVDVNKELQFYIFDGIDSEHYEIIHSSIMNSFVLAII